MALKTIIEKLGKLWRLGIVLTALIILGSWLPEITSGFVGDYFNKGQGGIVIVDSPEVYSRERLINDRFRQVAWLEDELDKSPDLVFGNQTISDLHKIMGLGAKVGNGNLSDEARVVEKRPKGGPGIDNGKRDRVASVSPSDRFRDVRAYRDEIRTEMMETLLDDRHDITGNTLYRLKFDTTVLPDENTEQFAVIQVRLAPAEFCELRTLPKHIPCISINSIYESWLKQTEGRINKSIEDTTKSFKSSNLSTPEFVELVQFLQGRVSLNDSENPENVMTRNIDDWGKVTKFLPACVDQVEREFFRQVSQPEDDKNSKMRERKIKSCPQVPVTRFFATDLAPETRARYQKVRKLLLRYYDQKLKYTTAYSDFRDIHEKFNDLKYDSLKRRAQGDFEAGIDEQIELKIQELIVDAEISEQILLRYAVTGMWIDKYTYSNDERQNKCEEVFNGTQATANPKSFSCIAHIEKTICADIDYCTVQIERRMPQSRRKVTGMMESTGVPSAFYRFLQIDESYYTYSVTPKESAQRVLMIESERRQKQLALSLIGSSGEGLDAGTLSSITRAISESTSQMEQIQRKPLVLGFGRGQQVVVDDIGNERSEIDFGWIIGPKYLFSDRSKGEIKFRHAPVHNSLSAVISVPGWWTALNIAIDTCWIDQDEISQLKTKLVKGLSSTETRNYVEDLCDKELLGGSHNVDIDYFVRLPGSDEELPRRFGYEIERAPVISDPGILADFYIGQEKASLIIQGRELWRSTVVTLGHQKANNIEVLPNMKGIIATFDKIDIPSKRIEYDPNEFYGRHANCSVLSEIVVWTSEGRSPEQQLFARIHANPILNPVNKTDQGEIYPEGFGDCFKPESNRVTDNPQAEPSDDQAGLAFRETSV